MPQSRNAQYEITLNYARNIGINILEVESSEHFTVPAINSVMCIERSKGPTYTGSIRNIEVRRDGKLLRVLVYEFLLNSDSIKLLFTGKEILIFVLLL